MGVVSHLRLVQISEPPCWIASTTRLLVPCQPAAGMKSKEGKLAGNDADFETS